MTKNLTQPPPYENEIDLQEIFKVLIESKKLIISTILIFTIVGIIFSLSQKPSFKTSTQLEIGYFTHISGEQELIEAAADLISDLNILILKNPGDKFNQKVSLSKFEGKVISLETVSSSIEKNENFLDEMVNYIFERHSNLAISNTNLKKKLITNEIKRNEAEKGHYELKLSNQTQSQYLEIIRNLDKTDQASEHLKLLIQNSSYNDKLFSLNQELMLLNEEIEILDSQVKLNTHLIGNIETQTIKPKTQLMILLGIIMGFITGILLVVIKSFIKNFRGSEA